MRKLTIAFFKAGLLEKKRILSYSSEKCTTFFKKSWFGYLENQLIFLPIESKYLQFFSGEFFNENYPHPNSDYQKSIC